MVRHMNCLRAWVAMVALVAGAGAARAATVTVSAPPGVTKFRGIVAITSVGAGPDFGHSAEVAAMAGRLSLGLVFLTDENAFAAYENRCTGGEFKMVLDQIAQAGTAAGHPEVANAPIMAAGHSHGGDYWNYFNACFPERFAVVFDKSGGGVQYSGAALKTPMVWEIGTNDLRNSHAGVFRGEMFAHRSKGSPMALVLGPGEDHTTFNAPSRQMVVDLLEAIWKLRVPEGADPTTGPVTLQVIDESSGQYWLGDNYDRSVSPWSGSPDRGALYRTSFLPTEAIASEWKLAGADLPADIQLDPGGVCTTCYPQPAGEPGATLPAVDAGAAVTGGAGPDGGASVAPPAANHAGGCSLGGGAASGLALLAVALLLLTRRPRR
jgi:hypothetical protein